ncbi:glycosyl hydrolase family 28-related protein [Sphingopyxis sp.]|uniref:glycosyl hydrolase family 28-related protein n=1 Tax=Sphingopyxis sp. TaxID=1908224 RepID=UPI001DF51938|nr:glycosyl hydrolase family 28-related protein [Sphingopyxis sp.]MBW8295546.1 glycoside hydrolase family 55 protein [Sphingopyxis sp.]
MNTDNISKARGSTMPYPRRDFLALSQGALLPILAGNVAAPSTRRGQPLSMLSFDNLNDLREFGRTEDGEAILAVVLGSNSPFDGGGGLFMLDSAAMGPDDVVGSIGGQESHRGQWRRLGESGALGQADHLDARAFGAKGDILSDDTRAIRDLIKASGTFAGTHGKTGYIQNGLYRLTGTLNAQSFSRLHGDGAIQSVFYNFQNKIPDIPVFTARNGLVFASFENFGMMSQRAGFDIEGDTDHNSFVNLGGYEMADAVFRFRGPLQTSLFDRILFDTSTYGIVCENAVVNRNTFREPEFKNIRNSAMKLAGAEDVLVIGGRFEGAGSLGRAILDLSNAHLITLVGGYFEGCHEYILKARNTAGLIAFESVHFTHFRPGVPYKWDVDEPTRLVFRNCHSTIPMTVPKGSLLEGINHNISVAAR